MADINQATWSETDASNNSASPNGWPSGTMLPSQVEPTARAMMGGIKRWYDRANATVTSGGTANAQTLTYSVAPTALVSGDQFVFKCSAANTGAMTLNVNGLGAIAVKQYGAALVGGEVKLGAIVSVYYDGTNFQLLPTPSGQWIGRQIFTSSGTYTPSTGCAVADVTIVGGGGAGGGSSACGAGQTSFGSGGAAGGASKKRILSPTSQTVTIGAGGTPASSSAGGNGVASSFGAILTANGGAGGATTLVSAAAVTFQSIGGTATGGDINIKGGEGWGGCTLSATGPLWGGGGGISAFGLGTTPASNTQGGGGAFAGEAALGYGSGGSGASTGQNFGAVAGGAGAPGICIIDEYR